MLEKYWRNLAWSTYSNCFPGFDAPTMCSSYYCRETFPTVLTGCHSCITTRHPRATDPQGVAVRDGAGDGPGDPTHQFRRHGLVEGVGQETSSVSAMNGEKAVHFHVPKHFACSNLRYLLRRTRPTSTAPMVGVKKREAHKNLVHGDT